MAKKKNNKEESDENLLVMGGLLLVAVISIIFDLFNGTVKYFVFLDLCPKIALEVGRPNFLTKNLFYEREKQKFTGRADQPD